MATLLGLDIGTTGAKATLIDESGRILKTSHSDYPLSTPRPGWAEQNPEDWWQAVRECIAEIGEKPDAIGLTGQMHGSVFLDSQDEVVRPALLWCDQRTVEECQEIDRLCGVEFVRETTCNPPIPGFQLPKILWLRRHEPECFARTKTVLLPKDYIVMRLTGEKSTDVSDASGVGAFDVRRREWSEELIGRVGLDRSLFPDSHESTKIIGYTREGVPVVAGAGDQAAGAVGVGAVEPGIVSISLGTSGVAFGSVSAPVPDPTGSAHVFCHANGRWHAMGVMLSCGGAVRWARDTFFPGSTYDEMTRMASETVTGCDGLSFLPYLSGERCPVIDANARGTLAGLSLSHSSAHIARAIFEGATFGLIDCLAALGRLGCDAETIRVTGGGSVSQFWVQMIADVSGKTCVTMCADEGPPFGAAILAGVGIGLWPDTQVACRETVRENERFRTSGAGYSSAYERYKLLYPALKDWGTPDNTIK